MSTKVYEILQEKILEKLDEGVIPWRKTWVAGEGAPRNIITNKCYKGFNHMMLLCQGFSSPYWLTFNQIKQLKGTLIKGEKSTIITYWGTSKKKDEDDDSTYYFIKYYRVFNLNQTEGIVSKWEKEIPKYNNSPIKNCEQILKEMREFPEIHWGMKPCYSLTTDKIGMPKLNDFETPEQYYSVFFHEMAHSTKAMHRMNRDTYSYAKEELIAEISASYLCGMAGIDRHVIDNQAAYIASWKKRIKEESVKLMVQVASEGEKVSNWILNINEFTEMKKEAA